MATIAGYILVGLISYFLYLDAESLKKINAETYQKEIRRGPLFWAVLGFFFFIFVAPIYLLRRSHFFRKKPPTFDQNIPSPASNEDAHYLASVIGIVVVWFFLLQLYSIVVYPSLLFMTHHKFNLPQGLNLTIAGFLVFVGTVFFLRDRKRSVSETLYLKGSEPNRWGSILLACFCGIALAGLFYLVQRSRTELPSTPLTSALRTSTSNVWIQFVIFGALIGPFFEEVIYRGFIFDVLNKAKGKAVAFGVVASIFAFLHFEQTSGDWIAMSLMVLLAFGLTYIRMSSNSIVPSIVAHYSYNICLFLIPLSVLFFANPSYATYNLLRDRLSIDKRISLLKKSVTERPKYWGAYNELAWTLVEGDRDLPEALRLIDIGLSGRPDRLAFLDTKAEILYKLKRFEEAVAIETTLVGKSPEDKFFKEQLNKFQKALDQEKAQAEQIRMKDEEKKITTVKPKKLKAKSKKRKTYRKR